MKLPNGTIFQQDYEDFLERLIRISFGELCLLS